MWFLFSVITLFAWSLSDLFSKIGCRDSKDKYSHLKMVAVTGIVMGTHAIITIMAGAEMNMEVFMTYLPVSALYISSMALGYFGLRLVELSVSTPICNSSGAVVALIVFATSGISEDLPIMALVALAFVCIGVIALGFVESKEDDAARKLRQEKSKYFYAKNKWALIIPVIYCILDALGTYFDSQVLEVLDEDSANCAYELTFLAVGIVCAIYVFAVKKDRIVPRLDGPKTVGAMCETAGQFFYVYALADSEHVAFSAPIMASYCMLSVVWGRIILKEKLSLKHYMAISCCFAGIIILGILDI